MTLTKEDAEQKVKEIMRGIESRFQLVPFSQFQKSHQGSSLKSNQYQKYFVLCHANSMYHAGWFVCPYVTSGFCPIQKGIMEMNSRKGGTNKFGRHVIEHEDTRGKKEMLERDLEPKCRQKIADAAALAVIQGLRPLGFVESNEGIISFASAVFAAGQSVPYGIKVKSSSYLPSRTAVKNS